MKLVIFQEPYRNEYHGDCHRRYRCFIYYFFAPQLFLLKCRITPHPHHDTKNAFGIVVFKLTEHEGAP